MAVANQGNIVVNVKKSPAGFIVEILPPAAHDLQRLVVTDAEVSSEQSAAHFERLFFRRLAEIFYRHDQPRVWRQTFPDLALTRVGNAGKIRGEIEIVNDDLKMQVGRPVA